MIIQLLYILLAIFGLGFLVFIHELGHYFVARRTKMTVEAFSIGFGKPIFSWVKDGVKWHIGSLPFGGYVKIKGMSEEDGKEPHEIKDGFFGRKPIDRIKVAVMGPAVNIVFALFAFSILYFVGGRSKSFSEVTHRIGWVDETSDLYKKGVRAGDEILEYGGRSFSGAKDLIYSGLTSEPDARIKGYKIDYYSGEKTPFEYTLDKYSHPLRAKDGFSTIGVLSPSNYLIYNKFPDDTSNPLLDGSPLVNSGISYGDRILWVDGELIFSNYQLTKILNDNLILVTAKRGDSLIQTQVPRIKLEQLNLSKSQKNELEDWKYETGLKSKLSNLYFTPYDLSSNGVVQSQISFIDEQEQKQAFVPCYRCKSFIPLQKGDKIIAIGGKKVQSSYEILQKLQNKTSMIIVQRNVPIQSDISWEEADKKYDSLVNFSHLQDVKSSIGTEGKAIGNLALLNPVDLKTMSEIQLNSQNSDAWKKQLESAYQQIAKIDSPEQKKQALELVKQQEKRYALGVSLQDQEVSYNPGPFALFTDVLSEMKRNLTALVTGYLSPKYLSGPVGIMHGVQHGLSAGYKEGIFWMGMISLNLGLFNLLPIPVLDGGHIIFSLYEMVTKRRIKAKTMEKMIIPFVVVFIGLAIYLTYHDIARIVSLFF